MNWWIAFRDPADIWENHPTFLLGELAFYLLAFLTLLHALRSGGRYPYLWISTILHGLTVESVSYFVPDIDNFWHAQSMVMLLGKRLPLHIVCFYPVFLYTAAAATARMRLSTLAESCMMGLAVVLLDVPFDIMGIKLLWWSWHDTDPNIYDRHYWVPWTSYYFHATFASSFMFLFHATRRVFCHSAGYKADGFISEVICCILVGLLSMPMGVLQFLPIYHPLHDNLGIHTEVCVFLLIGLYVMIVWKSDRQPTDEARNQKNNEFDPLTVHVFIHYTLYAMLAIYAKPENTKSTGLHEPVGNCSAMSSIMTAFGQELPKRKYLCASDYDEGYMDFHCISKSNIPTNGEGWYTACGTPYPNHIEYIVVVAGFCLFGLFVYLQMLTNSGVQPSGESIAQKKKVQ